MPNHSIAPNESNQFRNKVGEFAIGLGMLGSVGAGAYLVATDHINLSETILAYSPDNIQPSTAVGDALNATIASGALLGAGVLVKRGVGHVLNGFDDARRAEKTIAHAKQNAGKSKIRQRIGGASILVVGAGVTMGNFADIAHSVGSSQADVVGAIGGILGQTNANEEQFVITNTKHPELANNSYVPFGVIDSLTAASSSDITALPLRWEWHSALKNKTDPKQQILAVSLPDEITGLKIASEDCKDVNASTAKELGLGVGDTFEMDGLKVTVRGILDNASGAGLLPIVFNNEDFARCVDGNVNQPYSAVVAQGKEADIQKILNDNGISAENLASRAFIVPFAEFQAETQQTGENVSYPYIMQAIAEAMIFAGAALTNRASNRIIENRRLNTVAEANGTSKRQIAKREGEIAESEAIKSGLLAAPLVLVVDAIAGSGIPGAEIGPQGTTLLFVVGATWAANRVGAAYAMRREAGKINLAKGHLS